MRPRPGIGKVEAVLVKVPLHALLNVFQGCCAIGLSVCGPDIFDEPKPPLDRTSRAGVRELV
jgi:hypothetical protein